MLKVQLPQQLVNTAIKVDHYYPIKFNLFTRLKIFFAIKFKSFKCCFKSERMNKLTKVYLKGEDALSQAMSVEKIINNIRKTKIIMKNLNDKVFKYKC